MFMKDDMFDEEVDNPAFSTTAPTSNQNGTTDDQYGGFEGGQDHYAGGE